MFHNKNRYVYDLSLLQISPAQIYRSLVLAIKPKVKAIFPKAAMFLFYILQKIYHLTKDLYL